MGSTVLGIDEAGRGAVIGPLVVGGALIDENDVPKLRDLAVRDSKELTPHRREVLFDQIIDVLPKYKLSQLSPVEIDVARFSGSANLNDLEVQRMAVIINELKPEHAYIDCVDSSVLTFKNRLAPFVHVRVGITAQHGADKTFPIVSAASILAKVTRDREIEKLNEEYGNIGSGYPSDPTTQSFLSQWMKEHESFPDIVRKSWATAEAFLGKKKQKSLGDFK